MQAETANLGGNRNMWVIFLEIGVVIALAALIVWWTWPKKRRSNADSNSGKGKD